MTNVFGLSFSGESTMLMNLSELLREAGISYLDLDMDLIIKGYERKFTFLNLESIDDYIPAIDLELVLNNYGSLKNQLLLEVEKRIDLLPQDFYGYVTLDLCVESAKDSPQNYGEMLKFLKKILAIFLRRGIKVCVPLKVPMEVESSFYSSLASDLMMPNCFFALEIYPHKLKDKSLMKQIMMERRYDTGIIRIIYELSAGDIISEKLFSEIKSSLEVYPKIPICFFAPLCTDFSLLSKEIKRLGDIKSYVLEK